MHMDKAFLLTLSPCLICFGIELSLTSLTLYLTKITTSARFETLGVVSLYVLTELKALMEASHPDKKEHFLPSSTSSEIPTAWYKQWRLKKKRSVFSIFCRIYLRLSVLAYPERRTS